MEPLEDPILLLRWYAGPIVGFSDTRACTMFCHGPNLVYSSRDDGRRQDRFYRHFPSGQAYNSPSH
jgi:hypothetical protein